MELRIATRDSALALAQSREVAQMLERSGHRCVLLPMKTRGDVVLDKPLHEIDGKGLFTKEVDRAVLEESAELAVHSLKDMPVEDELGLILAAVPQRESDADVMVSPYASLEEFPAGAVVGCGSLRRRVQVAEIAPHISFADVRGNIQTRLRKMKENGWAGLVMAEAALNRLDLAAELSFFRLDILPAAGQGALGIRASESRGDVLAALAGMICRESMSRAFAERAFLQGIGGGCHTPAGLRSRVENGILKVHGVLYTPEGKLRSKGKLEGPVSEARTIGLALSDLLLE